MSGGWGRAWRALLAQFFQERCGGCGSWGHALLCEACEAAWPPLPEPACVACAAPLEAAGCPDCGGVEWAFSRVTAAGAYAGPLKGAVASLKYRGARGLAPLLAERMLGALSLEGEWLVVPVPVHTSRLRERGFNQAVLLGRAIARARRWRLAEPLERLTPTQPQHGLDKRSRLSNLAGVFRCREPLAGTRVLLVDDVMTTGATAHHAALALREAGAEDVQVLVAARTLPRGFRG